MDHNAAAVADRYAGLVERLRRAVFGSPATTDPATRSAAATGGRLPEPLAGYAAKVRDEPYRITDADVEALKAAGHSEDEVFEVTVSAAVGAALRSLDAGLDVVGAQE
jgi:alkylhydroperoxidase family enzyme